jgi:GDP-L-fucose synthase
VIEFLVAEMAIDLPRSTRIYVAGHRGLVGSAIVRRLRREGFENVLTATREQLDLRDQAAVNYWFRANRPEHVFLVAGTVGGILANSTRPAEFIYDNLMIHATVVHAAHLHGVRRLLYLGSSCIYPRECPQPIREEYLLTGLLEPTNEPYAIAKISGIKLCQAYRRQYGCDFISAMPTNLYGPHDNFDLESSHVLPALMRKFHDARAAGRKEVTIWGTGSPRREFLHVDDLADACLFLMRHYDGDEHVNVGTGEDLSIRELAELVREVVAPAVRLVFDTAKPDGMPRKLLDVSRLHALGWRHRIDLRAGIESTYTWFRDHYEEAVFRTPVPAATV